MKETSMKSRFPLLFSCCAAFASVNCVGASEDGPVEGTGLVSGQAESVGRVQSSLEIIPPQLKPLAEAAGNLSTVYGGIQSGIQMLQLLGVLETPPTVQDELRALHAKLESLAGAAEVINHAQWVTDVMAPALTVVHNIGIYAELCGDWATYNADWCGREMITCTDPTSCAANGLITVDMAGPTWTAFDKARKNEMFLRAYKDPGGDAPAQLKPILEPDGVTIHDWRLGIVELMHAISYRLMAISAIRPDWRQTREPWIMNEVMQFRDALQTHYGRMVGGIQCKVTNECGKSCKALGIFPIAGCEPNYRVHCFDRQTRSWRYHYIDYCDENPSEYTEWFSDDIAQNDTPFFEVKKMIDTLTFYMTNAPDLTASNERVRSTAGGANVSEPELCLDVQWGQTVEGTPLWLWPCTGNYAQHFRYDRASGSIYNPSIGLCADVQWANARAGTPIWQWWCNGGSAQRWTYDPATKLLTSALSPWKVLGARAAQQGMATLSWWHGPEFAAGQLWHPN